ncbi:MAG: mycofactocin-associated electron transfer flavoprotein alpha subunit [Acidimicrobiales bacterium]
MTAREARMIALVVVRDGFLPAGGAEAVAEAGGTAILVGDHTAEAAEALSGEGAVGLAEWGDFAPGRWAAALVDLVSAADVVVMPASADGRDLAPRLAHALGRPLFAGAVSVGGREIVLVRHGSRVAETHLLESPAVATLLPGVRGVEASEAGPRLERLPQLGDLGAGVADAEVLEVLAADPATMDLAEATKVVAGGAGLGHPDNFGLLDQVAALLGATPGATRVVADAGWVPSHRYIGTTGVSIDPELYVALGISGAVQHVTGIGHPDHVIAVNTDASAPMMAMADLAVVADAPAVVDELARRLGAGPPSAGP